MTSLAIGAVLGVAFILGVRSLSADRANLVYAVGLIVTAVIYLVFAVAGGGSSGWLALEFLGVILYGALALAGLRGNTTALAIGWGGHAGWDVLLHTTGAGAAYTPQWYPWACVGFDLVVAIAILNRGDSRDPRT